jgi:DNA-directed RNA polymerase specialized sigma24 family protein
MPQARRPGWSGTGEPAIPDPDEPEPLSDRLAADLAHLFDYCRALLEQDAEAARTARSVVDSAREPVPDRARNRAWLFALARSEALDLRPTGGDEPCYVPPALSTTAGQQTDDAVLRAFRELTDGDREILDLVYRHGIQPVDLSTVLRIAAEEAYRRLVNAEGELISLAAGPDAGPGAYLEDIAALPLGELPPPEDENQLDQSPPEFDRAAVWRAIASRVEAAIREVVAASSGRRGVQIAVAAVIPVAALAWALVYVAAPGHTAASRGAAVMPRGSASQDAGRSAPAAYRSAPAQPGVPVASATPASVPAPTATPAGLVVTVKAPPCPPGTKTTLRWHYTANGSPGGWSGPGTHVCPGNLTMGPQAMGNLLVTPGTTLQAGYDLSVPGNKTSLTMTVSAARVTFAISCVSKAVPSAPTFAVPLQTRTYQITSDQWFPSGVQTSPLVYQGSVSVPALCGPAGQISLAKGGTFTATLG